MTSVEFFYAKSIDETFLVYIIHFEPCIIFNIECKLFIAQFLLYFEQINKVNSAHTRQPLYDLYNYRYKIK